MLLKHFLVVESGKKCAMLVLDQGQQRQCAASKKTKKPLLTPERPTLLFMCCAFVQLVMNAWICHRIVLPRRRASVLLMTYWRPGSKTTCFLRQSLLCFVACEKRGQSRQRACVFVSVLFFQRRRNIHIAKTSIDLRWRLNRFGVLYLNAAQRPHYTHALTPLHSRNTHISKSAPTLTDTLIVKLRRVHPPLYSSCSMFTVACICTAAF